MSRVLLIEGEGKQLQTLAAELRARGYQVTEVVGRQQLGEQLAALHQPEGADAFPDWIITDAEQSTGPGMDLVLDAHGLRGGTPVILVADAADIDLLREAEVVEAAYVFYAPAEIDAVCRATQPRG